MYTTAKQGNGGVGRGVREESICTIFKLDKPAGFKNKQANKQTNKQTNNKTLQNTSHSFGRYVSLSLLFKIFFFPFHFLSLSKQPPLPSPPLQHTQTHILFHFPSRHRLQLLHLDRMRLKSENDTQEIEGYVLALTHTMISCTQRGVQNASKKERNRNRAGGR